MMSCLVIYSVYFTINHDMPFFAVLATNTECMHKPLVEKKKAIRERQQILAMIVYPFHLPPICPLGSGGTQAISRLNPMIMQPMIQKLSE
jgi:hypothetical protein